MAVVTLGPKTKSYYETTHCTVFSVVWRPGASLYLMQCLWILYICMSCRGTCVQLHATDNCQ